MSKRRKEEVRNRPKDVRRRKGRFPWDGGENVT
jgi:hypothetical protein